eukprot:m.73993 g.73993  ORF g.73993 m.73993 type:complete len:77 (+) comp18846_c0_seq1:77-307(+)
MRKGVTPKQNDVRKDKSAKKVRAAAPAPPPPLGEESTSLRAYSDSGSGSFAACINGTPSASNRIEPAAPAAPPDSS